MGPGFDTLGVALSLRNEVDVKRSKFFSVSIRGEGKNSIKMKSGNIFVNIFNEQYKNITGKKDKDSDIQRRIKQKQRRKKRSGKKHGLKPTPPAIHNEE